MDLIIGNNAFCLAAHFTLYMYMYLKMPDVKYMYL